MKPLLVLALALTFLLTPSTAASGHELIPGQPIELSADGDMRTALLLLEGDYAIDWTAEGRTYFNITLKSSELTGEDWLVRNERLEGRVARRTHTYGLKRAHYYFDVTGGCPWRVTLTPLKA